MNEPVGNEQEPTTRIPIFRQRNYALSQNDSDNRNVQNNKRRLNDEKKYGSKRTFQNPKNFLFQINALKNVWNDPIFWLNAVAIIWGSQHAVIKMVVDDSDAESFTLLRFFIGAVIATVFAQSSEENNETADYAIFGLDDVDVDIENSSSSRSFDIEKMDNNKTTALRRRASSTSNRKTWRWGAEMGFWMFLGFAFQAVGLKYTTAQRSGFLLYLNVKFVPFFAYLLFRRKISLSTWISAFVAFGGTALLASDHRSSTLSLHFNTGDWWSIAAAAASAMFILRLEKASQNVPSASTLNAACLWVVTLLAALWTIITMDTSSSGLGIDSTIGGGVDAASHGAEWLRICYRGLIQKLWTILTNHPSKLFYLSAITTALANYIQTKVQKDVTAERAAVIYAMDPVHGAVFSYLLLGESLDKFGFVGAAMITFAAITNALFDFNPVSTGNDKKLAT